MISKSIIDAVIKQANNETKNMVLSMFIEDLANRSYNDDRINHVLEIMLCSINLICFTDINLDYIKENFNKFLYNYEKYNVKDIHIGEIDNLNGLVKVDYKYIDKINEDRGDIDYNDGSINVSFLDYPKILK